MSGVVGGVSSRPLSTGQAQLLNPDILSASTAIQQAGGGAFARLINALQLLDQSGNVIALASNLATLTTDITTMQAQIATLQTQMTGVRAWINDTLVETATGFTWLDGRQVYKKCVTYTVPNVTNTVVSTPHGIAALAYFVNAEAILQQQSANFFPLTWVNVSANPPTDGTSFYMDTTNIYVALGPQVRSNYLIAFTFWYTATNR